VLKLVAYPRQFARANDFANRRQKRHSPSHSIHRYFGQFQPTDLSAQANSIFLSSFAGLADGHALSQELATAAYFIAILDSFSRPI
jgi:hypothetical protein